MAISRVMEIRMPSAAVPWKEEAAKMANPANRITAVYNILIPVLAMVFEIASEMDKPGVFNSCLYRVIK